MNKKQRCINCGWRDEKRPDPYAEFRTGYKDFFNNGSTCRCQNIYDSLPNNGPSHKKQDLVYPYFEGGEFWAGDDFGCVHFKQK